MINIRKLAAVDMTLNGTRFILWEFALGVVLPLILGLLSIRAGFMQSSPVNWENAMGFWLVGIALNYIPLFLYATLIAKAGSVKQEGGPEVKYAKRYGVQQVIILIPLLVVLLALAQETQSRQRVK